MLTPATDLTNTLVGGASKEHENQKNGELKIHKVSRGARITGIMSKLTKRSEESPGAIIRSLLPTTCYHMLGISAHTADRIGHPDCQKSSMKFNCSYSRLASQAGPTSPIPHMWCRAGWVGSHPFQHPLPDRLRKSCRVLNLLLLEFAQHVIQISGIGRGGALPTARLVEQ